MSNYSVENSVSPEQIKSFRKSLRLTQAQFASLIGVSKPTVERWETSKNKINGPLAVLIDLLEDNMEIIEDRKIPEKVYSMRLKYMFKNKCCTTIDVDISKQKIMVKNYTKNIFFRAFGANNNPNYGDYEEFLKSRCFPESRDKMKLHLRALNLPFYDPLMIIEKTGGRMAEDDFWIEIER